MQKHRFQVTQETPLCEAWWSGLPATVCPVQTAQRYYSQLYYNYAGGTRVLTLDFISGARETAFTRWTVLFIDGRSCFHRAGSVVSRGGLFQIANTSERKGCCNFSALSNRNLRFKSSTYLFQRSFVSKIKDAIVFHKRCYRESILLFRSRISV